MSPIVPYESDNPYRQASLKEALAFWKYMYSKGPVSIILYFLSALLLLVVFDQLAMRLFPFAYEAYMPLVVVAVLFIFPMLFFALPAMPRQYMLVNKGKIRPDIPEEELTQMTMDMIRKSLEMSAIGIIIIGILCVAVYIMAQYLALSDIVTLVLEAATVLNGFLLFLVIASLGRYNRDLLKKTFIEEEYRRYTSLGGYKRIFMILLVFDALMVAFLFFITVKNPGIGMTATMLVAILVNLFLALSLWNYREMKGKSENERKALMPQMRLSLAALIAMDVVFIASFVVQWIWPNISYEMAVLDLFMVFSLTAGVLSILWFVFNFIRRHLASRV